MCDCVRRDDGAAMEDQESSARAGSSRVHPGIVLACVLSNETFSAPRRASDGRDRLVGYTPGLSDALPVVTAMARRGAGERMPQQLQRPGDEKIPRRCGKVVEATCDSYASSIDTMATRTLSIKNEQWQGDQAEDDADEEGAGQHGAATASAGRRGEE